MMNMKINTGVNTDTKAQEELQRQKDNAMFNSITQKVKVENQNRTHNARKEGIAPINQKR